MAPLRAEILAGRRGQQTVRVVAEHGREAYLHSLYDPAGEARGYVPDAVGHGQVPVFLGTGLGYHLEPFLAAHPHVKRIVLVEIYPELAAAVAVRAAAAGVTAHVMTTGPDGAAGPLPALPAGLDAASLTFIPHPPSRQANPTWYARCHALLATAGLPARDGERVGTGRPLTLLVLFGAYYGQKECIRGLESLGHRVVTVDYRDGTSVVDRFGKALIAERPDRVFSINMRGLDDHGAMAEMLRRLGIPLSVWFVDSPEFILREGKLPPPELTTMHLWDRSYAPMVEALGYRTAYLPLAADPALQRAAVVDDRFRCDISFVGNSLVSGFLARLAVKFPRTPETEERMEHAVDAVLAHRGGQLEALDTVLEGCRSLDAEERLFFRAYALHSATTRYRTALLAPLVGQGLAFFGDPPGWREIFGDGIAAHPDVNYFHETPSVYVSSAVNFNATSLQMPMAVNQRVFDVPLCGGFLLTDRQGALGELFAEDEVAVYDGAGDAADKAAHYLARPAERQAIGARARARVENCHTYHHRMHEMLQQAV